MMPSVSSHCNDHSLTLHSLTQDEQARQGESKASSLHDALPSTGTKGPLRSEWRHTLGKDMLAFFILGIIVSITRLLHRFSSS